MKRCMTMAALGLVLASCSGEDKGAEKVATPADAARKVKAAGLTPEPGQYRVTVTMTGIEIPGMPPEMEGHGAGLTTTTDYCLTKADVDKGFAEMVKRGQNGDCSYENFALAGGDLDAVMVCKTPAGDTRTEMTGKVTKTSSELNATTALDFGPDGKGTMTFDAKHERLGDCPRK